MVVKNMHYCVIKLINMVSMFLYLVHILSIFLNVNLIEASFLFEVELDSFI